MSDTEYARVAWVAGITGIQHHREISAADWKTAGFPEMKSTTAWTEANNRRLVQEWPTDVLEYLKTQPEFKITMLERDQDTDTSKATLAERKAEKALAADAGSTPVDAHPTTTGPVGGNGASTPGTTATTGRTATT
jgi:hypothetical protein